MSVQLKTEEEWEADGLGIAGRQQVVEGPVQFGDLLVFRDGWRYCADATCCPHWANAPTSASSDTYRVYRRMPVPKQGAMDHLPDAAWQPKAEVVRKASLPKDPAARKALPVCSGVLDYFPNAILAVAQCSKAGNDQHSPGQPLHWDRSKSGDEADALVRHLLQRGSIDTDGVRHSAKVAWRALALLQKEIEAANE